MSIRKMTLDDLKIVANLEEKLFSSPWSENDFYLELTNNPMAEYYVIEDKDIIGYVGLWMMGDQCQITTIGVDDNYQGKGYASSLMEYVSDRCESLSYQNINLEVRVSNYKAIALYEKYGFKNVAVRKRYYQNGEDAYLMIKEMEG